jgi:lipopolysaccharide export system protein LptA
MACKNCAAMNPPRLLLNPRRLLQSWAPALLAGALATLPAWAEKADRDKPLNIVSERGGLHDAAKQLTEFSGKVILTKGTMQLSAETLSVRERSDGFVLAIAQGREGEPVSFRQARDVPGESIAGTAGQVEYDARTDTVRFSGAAIVRILRGSLVLREISGAVLVYDNRSERVSVEAGQTSPNPRGGVRMTIMPREAAAPASAIPLQAVPPVPRNPS